MPLAITVATDGPTGSLAGLDEVATVVEYAVTEGTTALVAVSRAGTAAVGPLRQATDADIAIAEVFGADLVTSTASTASADLVGARSMGLVEESAPAGAVLRDPARRAPYNLYTLPDRARQLLGSRAAELDGPWRRGGAPPAGGRTDGEVAVAITAQVDVVWTWDAPAAAWARTDSAQTERLADGTPVTAATVVVLEVADPRAGMPGSAGVGPAVVLRDGRRHAARWSRDRRSAAVALTSRDGAVFAVDGRVWVTVCAAPCAQQISPSAPAPG